MKQCRSLGVQVRVSVAAECAGPGAVRLRAPGGRSRALPAHCPGHVRRYAATLTASGRSLAETLQRLGVAGQLLVKNAIEQLGGAVTLDAPRRSGIKLELFVSLNRSRFLL